MQEKEFLKKVIKIFIAFFSSGIILLLALTSAITIMIFSAKSNSITDDGGLITDIGALGVPQEYIPYYNEASTHFNIPNWVLAAVSKQESNFNSNASYGGAYGIMQIQKNDILTGIDLWANHIRGGLGEEYKKFGYKFSTSDEMWNIYLTDPKSQIIAGAYILRYYANYVLYRLNKVENLNYLSNENLNLIKWNAKENSSDFKEFKDILRRIFACYNGGPNYGMNVDLDNAQHNYPNKVFDYAMEFRDVGLNSSSNEIVEKAIKAGEKWVGKSPYVWGGGRTEEDIIAGRFDCSSFVHYMYASARVQLGDRASVVTFSLVNMGRAINPKDMKRGDLLFFDTYTTDGHVAVYLGNGKFIHDGPTNGVEITNINLSYWQQTFNGKVRRVVE
ncbi:MAG: C40 family peptidase [Clostridium sp.]|nr:C40 family peptidase [Clostridium sp.]